jgi:hypothetical protein
MKKIIFKLFLIIMFLNISACKDDLLEISNPNTLTETEFWLNETDAELGVNAIYAMFYKPGVWSRWIFFRLDLTSDEGYSNSPWPELKDWTRFNYVNYNFWEGNVQTWRDTYKAIWRCNQVLANVPEIEFEDNEKKERILAQAKFLRGLHYYYAALLWENVPLVLTPPAPDDLAAQNTLSEVWAQVEKDFSEAADVLPQVWDDRNVGRPTKGAAKAYLARTLMQQHKWSEAKLELDYLVVGEGKDHYGLVPNFRDNFTHLNENNMESVFEIQFSDANKTDDGEIPNANMGNNRAQFFAPRGIGWSDGQPRRWLVDEFMKETTMSGERDPRLEVSFFFDYMDERGPDNSIVYGTSFTERFAQRDQDNKIIRDSEGNANVPNDVWYRKYARDYYRDNEDYFSEVNIRLLRFADVLLMYAEVLNELDQTAEAYQYVNMVRARAELAPLAEAYPSIGNDKDAFRNRLKMERALELNGESVRWADLKRWGDLETPAGVQEVAQRDPDFEFFEVGKNIRLPIPQVEVLNNPNLEQNPRY